MSNIQMCLSVFAVAAWANKEDSLERAERAVDAYVGAFCKTDELPALRALQTAYSRMSLDSRIAIAIKRMLEERIAFLMKHPGPVPTANNERQSV